MKDLKLCPFCGGTSKVVSRMTIISTGPIGYVVAIRCNDCFAEIDNSDSLCKKYVDETVQDREVRFKSEMVVAKEEIITMWNRRLKCS